MLALGKTKVRSQQQKKTGEEEKKPPCSPVSFQTLRPAVAVCLDRLSFQLHKRAANLQ